MSARIRVFTVLVAIALFLVGFVGGGIVAAWVERDKRADPWRQLRVDHEGQSGTTTHTRVIFDNPKVALQGVGVVRAPSGAPETGTVEIRGGAELDVRFGDDGRPKSYRSPSGTEARLAYKGTQARVVFLAKGGKALADTTVAVPVLLRTALEMAALGPEDTGWSLIAEAHAQAGGKEPPKQVDVRREVVLPLTVTLGKGGTPGEVRVQVTCSSYTCVPLTPTIDVPGASEVRIQVSSQHPRGADPQGGLTRFEEAAVAEARTAQKVLSDASAIISGMGVVAHACAKARLTLPLCVPVLTRDAVTGGAIQAVRGYDVPDKGPLMRARAVELFHEEQARAALDRPVDIEVCFSRSKYARVCTKLSGRPFGATPMKVGAGSIELKRGISGSVEGTFEMRQSDGPDCKFSPSPRTNGPLTISFDGKTGKVTGRLSANAKGTRPGLSCSLGSGDMRWTQNYSATMTQQLSPSQLTGGGQLQLNLTGTMSGSGSTSQSNCRTRGGASAACPSGRNETYNYPIRLTGTFDLDTESGSGSLVVTGAPLATSGTWRVPAAP
ncbi:MAG TPA: hypothetical protein ENK57_05760 [Polyangiaceae bacterium]|nr:hypothetical protein [Polyangiaceae bacterium]